MSPPLPSAVQKSAWSLAALGLITVVGAALRLWQTRESLWLDELHTAWCALGSLAEVAPRAAIGNQSPLFYWLEWLLVRLLGPSELALRLPSVIAGSLLPIVIYGLCRRWGQSSGIGLLAAALIVVDPLSIFFATEARPYALVQLLAAIHVGVTVELFARPSGLLRIAFIIGAALLFHLHYTAALLIPAELTFWMLASMQQAGTVKYRWSSAMSDVALIGIACLPALSNVWAIFGRRENWAAFVASRSLWAPWEIFDIFPWSFEVVVFSAMLLLFAWIARRWQLHSTILDEKEARQKLVLVICWLVVPALLTWIATATGAARLHFARYLAASAPAAMLLVALSVSVLPSRWSRLVSAGILLLAVCTSGIIEQSRLDRRVIGHRREDWRGAIGWLNERLPQDRFQVLVASGLIEADALLQPHARRLEDYCLFPVTSLYPLTADRRDLVPLQYRKIGPLEPSVRERFIVDGRLWLVMRGRRDRGENVVEQLLRPAHYNPRADLPNRDWQIEEFKSFAGVQILLLRHQPLDPN